MRWIKYPFRVCWIINISDSVYLFIALAYEIVFSTFYFLGLRHFGSSAFECTALLWTGTCAKQTAVGEVTRRRGQQQQHDHFHRGKNGERDGMLFMNEKPFRTQKLKQKVERNGLKNVKGHESQRKQNNIWKIRLYGGFGALETHHIECGTYRLLIHTECYEKFECIIQIIPSTRRFIQ